MRRHGRHVGQNEQALGTQGLAQHGRGPVLVNDGFQSTVVGSAVGVLFRHDRNTSPTGTNDNAVRGGQLPYHLHLGRNQLDGSGRRHNASKKGAVGPDENGQGLSFGSRVDGSDKFGRMLQGGIVGVHDNLGQERRHAPVGVRHQGLEFLFNQVANHAFCFGIQYIQCGRGQSSLFFVGGTFEEQESDLGTVAVYNRDGMVIDNVLEGCHTRANVLALIVNRHFLSTF